MTGKELIERTGFTVLNRGTGSDDREIENIFCCDLLSIAMSRMPENAAWVTVMSNVNTLAVATLSDAVCVVLAEGVACEDAMKKKAEEQGIMLLATDLPVYEAAKKTDISR